MKRLIFVPYKLYRDGKLIKEWKWLENDERLEMMSTLTSQSPKLFEGFKGYMSLGRTR